MSLSTQALSLAAVNLRRSQSEGAQHEQASSLLIRGLVDRGTTPPSAVTAPNNTSFNVSAVRGDGTAVHASWASCE